MSIPVQGTNHFIPLEAAAAMTRRYRDMRNKILKEEFKGQHINAICETFDRKAFDVILAQRGCVGLRMYFGMNESNMIHTIVVGVNEKNEDMITPIPFSANATLAAMSSETLTDPTDPILEQAQRCPPDCPPDSPLNG